MLTVAEPAAGTAVARMTRVLVAGAAGTGLAFSVLSAPVIARQWTLLPAGYALGSTLALTLGPALLLALAFWAPLGLLRGIGLGYVLLYAAVVLSWPFAMQSERIPDGTQPWVINLLPMPSLCIAVVLTETASWLSLAGLWLSVGWMRYLAGGAGSLAAALQNTLFNATTISVFVVIVFVTLRAGRQRDDAARATVQDAAIAAAAQAQDLQRAQVAALTHDDVLSTLLAAARSTDATAPLVRRHAARALARVDELGRSDGSEGLLVDSEALLSLLRDTAAALAPEVTVAAPALAPVSLPSVVARTLAEATAEALRNSLRHAPAEAERTITLRVTAGHIEVEVRDDGPGFDPEAVPPDRFGLRYSVRHRMSLVPGGAATIESLPGAGTVVRLHWDPDGQR
ncbi:MAG: ATP-binding protein [Microbacteriaceae bacterium]